MGVVPEGETFGDADGAGRFAAHGQQRTHPEHTGYFILAHRRHAHQARAPRTAGEAEQHGLGLIVEGVAEKHRRGADALSLGAERVVSGIPGRGLGPPLDGDLDGDDPGREAERPGGLGRGLGLCRRCILQPVVDHDGGCLDAEPRGLERDRRGQGERVSAARERDNHARFGRAGVAAQGCECRTNGGPHGGNGGVEPPAAGAGVGSLGHAPTVPGPVAPASANISKETWDTSCLVRPHSAPYRRSNL